MSSDPQPLSRPLTTEEELAFRMGVVKGTRDAQKAATPLVNAVTALLFECGSSGNPPPSLSVIERLRDAYLAYTAGEPKKDA